MARPIWVEPGEPAHDDAAVLAKVKPHVGEAEPIVIVAVSMFTQPGNGRSMVGLRLTTWRHDDILASDGEAVDLLRQVLHIYDEHVATHTGSPPTTQIQ